MSCYLNVLILKESHNFNCSNAHYEYTNKHIHKASTKPPAPPCGHGEWQCANDECINVDFVCDGTPDCIDNSDEGSLCNINRGKFSFDM